MGRSNSAKNMPAICVKDVDQQEFVVAFAAFLKKSGKIKVPAWADQVKTAVFKQLSPYDQDWYYIRCASLARHLYMRGNAGVGAFRRVYGGSKDNGFLHPTSDKPTETSSENVSNLWKLSNW